MTATKAVGGRPKGLCRGAIYTAVLEKIAREGFQSLPELRTSVLREIARPSSWRVMKKLTDEGLLVECRGDVDAILGWILTPKGQTVLRQAGIKSHEAGYRHPVYKTSYIHDVTLREVKNLLIQSSKVSSWVPEHIVKAEAMRSFQYMGDQERRTKFVTIPDGLFRLNAGGKAFRAALELELTRKSRARIRHKFEAHMTNSNFEFVFFIVKGEELLKTLWAVYHEVMEHSIEVKFQNRLNGMYFTLLENVQERGLKTLFAGKHNTFSFA